MSQVFEIKEHVLECQHIREYARATLDSQEAVLHLAIKQYIPRDNPNPQDGDVTIIGAHANGFPKELYEPLWEDLYASSKSHGFRIHSIWIADVAQQGQSGVLNEDLLGNEASWMDHSRDLLHMTNVFRAEMPRPLIGIGHSLGGVILTNLALLHPRLLSSLVLLDPVLHHDPPLGQPTGTTRSSAFRRDVWPSRDAAEASFRRSKFYQSWDPRVLDRWCRFGIRETPTPSISKEDGDVTLTTTRHQECFTFVRHTWEAVSADGMTVIDREAVPEFQHLGGESGRIPDFYRPETPNTFARLGELRPSTLYVFGDLSDMSYPAARKAKLDVTGASVGGSGGVKEGRVKEVVLKDVGHLVAMEASQRCAEAMVPWIAQEMERFREEKKRYVEWTKLDREEKTTLSEEWKRRIGGPLRPPKAKGKL